MSLFGFFGSTKSLEDMVRGGKLHAVRKKLKQGVNQEELDACICPAVHSGVGMVRLLLENGANVNHMNKQAGNTPLHIAAKYGYVDVAQLLIEHSADLNAKNSKGNSPLDCAFELPADRQLLALAGAPTHPEYKKEDQGKNAIAKLLQSHGAKHG